MVNKKNEISNIKIKKSKESVFVSINPKIYPLDVIYTASYVFIDRAYVLIDGEPEKKIIVELKPKKKENLERLGREFNNELLHYSFYKYVSDKTRDIRITLLQRALLTNDPSLLKNKIKGNKKKK